MRRIVAMLLSVCAILSCGEPLSPLRELSPQVQALAMADTVIVSYACSNKFRIANSKSVPVMVTWTVEGTGDTGRVVLPPKPRPGGSYDTFIATRSSAAVVFGVEGFAHRVANGGRSCLAGPPERTPKALWDSLTQKGNILDNPPGVHGRVIRNTLYVAFTPSATDAQKDAAIAAINGEVIGGAPFNAQGYYLVRIPMTQAARSAEPLLRAQRTLRRIAGVRSVILSYMDDFVVPLYRLPDDSLLLSDWHSSPDSADGINWSLEGINAPYGWGCDDGGFAPPTAAVDRGFHDIPDLQGNLGAVQDFASATDTRPNHGTWIASIFAARGNNAQGIPGTMWQAHLGLYDADLADARTTDTVWYKYYRILSAGDDGNRVINISMGLFWLDWKHRRPAADSADSNIVRAVAERFGSVIAGHPRTLYVVAASNDAVDAWWGGFAAAATDSANRAQMLVVGATQIAPSQRPRQARWQDVLNYAGANAPAGSNIGELVDVMAPGASVPALDRNSLGW